MSVTARRSDITVTQRFVNGDYTEWTAEFDGPLSTGPRVHLIHCAAGTFAEACDMLEGLILEQGWMVA